MKRVDVLEGAKVIVMGERNEEYGGPEDTFNAIAKLWEAYLNTDIGAADVAIMMILLKVARLAGSSYSSADSWIDIAGYAACGSEISGCEAHVAVNKVDDEVKKANEELKEKLAAMAEEYSNLSIQYAELEAQLKIAQHPAPAVLDPERDKEIGLLPEKPKKKQKNTNKTLEEIEEEYRTRKIDDIPKLKSLRNAGWSLTKIAEEFRCSAQTVANTLKREGLE